MTKEEVKKYFINMREAINVLEKELCEDISEDGTLTVNVEDGTKVSRVLVCGNNHFGGLYYPDEVLSRSENPNKWIPCEKRLPDKLQDVLVTFYDAEGEYDVAYMRKTFNATYKAQGSENEWVSSMGETTYADYEVSAWMPIEPYKSESEE